MFSLLNKEELNQFFNRDEILILAVSTGIDSMCLFHYLYNNGYNIVVAHVNHQKRIESIKEYEYIEK